MKESEIRDRNAHLRYLELARQDSNLLLEHASRFVAVACPCCGSDNHSPAFEKIGFTYDLCEVCETLFVTPRPRHDDLFEMYANSVSAKFWVEEFFRPMAEARRTKIFRPRAEVIAERFPQFQSGAIADIGAGFGMFLKELQPLMPSAELVAIEPSAEMAAICREKDLGVIESMMEDVEGSDGRFDLVTMFELFEHLEKPQLFLEKVRSVLKPDGYLCLTTLNGLGFDIQLLWSNSKAIFPPQHLNFANPGSLTALLEQVGFIVEEVSTPGELDWDIVEGSLTQDGVDPGRFFTSVHKHGTAQAKSDLQSWIKVHNFSSHMRILARRVDV